MKKCVFSSLRHQLVLFFFCGDDMYSVMCIWDMGFSIVVGTRCVDVQREQYPVDRFLFLHSPFNDVFCAPHLDLVLSDLCPDAPSSLCESFPPPAFAYLCEFVRSSLAASTIPVRSLGFLLHSFFQLTFAAGASVCEPRGLPALRFNSRHLLSNHNACMRFCARVFLFHRGQHTTSGIFRLSFLCILKVTLKNCPTVRCMSLATELERESDQHSFV